MLKATDINPVLFQALAFLSGRAYEDAVAHGLYDHPALNCAMRSADAVRQRLTLLIREEVSEMWEAYDNPAHFAEELADVVIMCMSASGHMGIDLAAEVRRKMEINEKRPYGHERPTA